MKAGDTVKVIAVNPLPGNDVAPSLILNKEYPIVSTILDSKGNLHLNLGLRSRLNFVRSYETKEELPDGDKIHWVHPSRVELV